MISRILNKIVEDKVEQAILVIPHWVSQSWFPLVLSLLIDFPIRIPRHQDQLTLRHNGQIHPMGRSLSLAGVIVSGVSSKTRAFQMMLPQPSVVHGGPEWKNSIVWRGRRCIWALARKRNPVCSPEVTVLSYLQFLMRQGRSYSLINTHKSMLLVIKISFFK